MLALLVPEKSPLVVLTLALFMAGTALPAAAATIVVDGAGGGDVLTIQAGIDAAGSGDQVLVRSGVYGGPGNIGLDFGGKAISLESESGADVTMIDCGGDDRAVFFHSGEGSDSIFRGFTVTSGSAAFGGAIFCLNASPTVEDCLLTDCQAFNAGGAVACSGSPALFRRVTISNCGTSPLGDGGGMALGHSDVRLIEVAIEGCTAFHGGGGIYGTGSSPTLENCVISGNTAHNNGGGIHLTDGSSPLIRSCTVSGNSSDDDGAGIYCHNDSSPRILGCAINDNTAGRYGGGIYCDQGSDPLIRGNVIAGNDAWAGGGVFCYTRSAPRVVSNLIRGNETLQGGGGIACFRTRQALISGNRIEGNSSSDAGGIGIDLCSPTVTDNVIRDNVVEWSAAGLLITRESSAVVINNLIVENQAGYSGGGLYVTRDSTPALINLTVVDNAAEEDGGGCYFSQGAGQAVPLENCIIYGNRALAGGDQVFISGSAWALFSHTDLQGGQAGIGGSGDVTWGAGNIDENPLWAGITGDYYLSQLATGHSADSPCLGAGSVMASEICYIGYGGPVCLDARTTRMDGVVEDGLVDMGFHYASRIKTLDCSLNCTPGRETPPFTWRISVGLQNLRPGPRRAAGRADLHFADGGTWTGWRSGFYNLMGQDREYISWSVDVPALPSLLGQLRIDLTVADVTPAPWNQPPYAPSGDEINKTCTVDVTSDRHSIPPIPTVK
jgi:parallel beta-helix repeat protein